MPRMKTELPLLSNVKDYRKILSQELEDRCSVNPRYSLRAFARDIGIAAPRLSLILQGKQGLSYDSAKKISQKLGLAINEQKFFCDLVESNHSRSKLKRKFATLRLQQLEDLKLSQLQVDVFKTISDWYHYAILELTTVKGFKSSPEWIARKLDLQVNVVRSAIERLIRIDQLEKLPDGNLAAKFDFTVSPNGIPSESIKKFHTQVLEKALVALRIQSVEERDFSSITLAFDSEKLIQAKELIRNFRRDFNKKFSQEKKADHVYCLAIQFFKFTQNHEGNNS